MLRLFYHDNAAAAVARGKELRTGKTQVSVTHTLACSEADAVDGIDFMPDVPAFERQRLCKLFDVVDGAPAVPPPPGPPPNPLDGLSEDWKSQGGPDELKKIAAALSGRAMDNREQAVAVIEAALIARK